MSIKTFSVKGIMDREEVEELRDKSAGNVHAYLEYNLDNDKQVLIEFVSRDMTEEILGLFPADQKRIVGKLCQEVPDIGQQILLVNNSGKRGSRVIRVEPAEGYDVHLIVTH